VDIDSFIEKYRPEWERLDNTTKRGSRGLAKLSGGEITDVVNSYLRVASHLAEVQTRYRDERLERYLNATVSQAHAAIYGAKPASLRGFVGYFGARYRRAIGETRPYILLMAALMVAVALVTTLWISTSREAQAGLIPTAARETIRRATGERSGGLGLNPGTLSSLILLNNVRVGFLSFALGITLGVGTAWVVIQNSLLLGSLAGAYHAGGKAFEFWSLILPHGLLELVAICIAAGAGIRMGWALVDPKDRSRGDALADEARGAVLVIVGVIPAFIVAAIIEGFLTGTPLLPASLEIAIGAVTAAAYVVLLFGVQRRPKALMRR
jgi:uncharacterized membrane protein SpoIIM required for sporulation